MRYRGYYYDEETGLYYLQSRYYDAGVRRFINADAFEMIGNSDSYISYNLYAYCDNNPGCKADKFGYSSYTNYYYPQKNGSYIINTVIRIWDVRLTFTYSISKAGAIAMLYSKNPYYSLLWRGGASILATAMYYAYKHIKKTTLQNRTIGGINNELILHYIATYFGIARAYEVNIGSMKKGSSNYDNNAWWFESANAINSVNKYYWFGIWSIYSFIKANSRYFG